MSSAELQQLTDAELQTYFEENARYRPDAPRGQGRQYTIYSGRSRFLYSDDTADLREKFFASVRGR